jgi:ribosomal protein S18 acetylase RimI-like enzyme
MQGLVIREGIAADVEPLLAIESRAARLLLEHGGHDLLAMHVLSRDDLLRGVQARLLRVAEIAATPVGFALAGEIDGHAHLYEIDVDPEHGRRGIGSALLASVCEVASALGLQSITLVTLRDVPWNAPFYAGRGFVELADGEWGHELRSLMECERMLGINSESRAVMRRMLPFSRGRREAE